MKKAIAILSLLISLNACKPDKVQNASSDGEKGKAITDLGKRYFELGRFSGAILVAKQNDIVFHEYFGQANQKLKQDFTENTTFKIGEITELFTKEIIMQLVDDGKLILTEQVSKYIPDLKTDYTILDFLNHKTQLPTIRQLLEVNHATGYETILFANYGFNSNLKSDKSELNYNILGLLIETVDSLSYNEQVTLLSAKLGLKNTNFKNPNGKLATGYLYYNQKGEGLALHKAPVSKEDITFSSRGLKSTPNDLLLFLNKTTNEDIAIDGYLQNDGFSYSLIHKNEFTIIILSNRRHPVALEMAKSIEAIYNGNEYELPLARKPFDIEKNLLNEYEGVYTLNEYVKFKVFVKDNALYVKLGSNNTLLIPQSKNQFYMQDKDAAMRFYKDENGIVTKVYLLNGFINSNEVALKSSLE